MITVSHKSGGCSRYEIEELTREGKASWVGKILSSGRQCGLSASRHTVFASRARGVPAEPPNQYSIEASGDRRRLQPSRHLLCKCAAAQGLTVAGKVRLLRKQWES
jgi:hypothetical protein